MPRYSIDTYEEALKRASGHVSVAAKLLGCSPSSIYRALARSPRLRQVLEDARGELLDWAELRLAEAVMRGEPWAIQFTLRTQGRDRGYGDHITVDLNLMREEAARLAREYGLTVEEVMAEVMAILRRLR